MDPCGSNNYTKRCRVCGDIALGFNFNGLSCESCKAFFRRNAFKHKTLKCKREKQCNITIANRKRCKLCRLEACFKNGMKKELILMFKDDKKQDNESVLENNSALETRLPIVYDLKLPVYEMERLREVQEAMNREFCDARKLKVVGVVTNMNDGLNLAGYYVKNICKFVKHIAAFESLPLTDQIQILKSFFFDILAVRFAFTYDEKIDGFPIAENETHDRAVIFPLKILDQWEREDIVPVFRKYHSGVRAQMENDTVMRDLLIAQCLFSKDDTTCPEYMRYQYHIYNRLLKLYLFHKYKNVDKVEKKYASLMGILKEGEVVRKLIEDMYTAMELTKIQPVIAELYNMY